MGAPGDTQAIRQRFLTDFAFYARHCLKIRTKDGEIAPLILNRAQRHLLAVLERQWEKTGRIRVVILKGRQQGLSTLVEAWLYWRTSQAQAMRTLVMAHKAESSTALFGMAQRYHENCPALLKQATKWSNRKELAFSALDSSYLVATAGADGVARGETLNHAHLSEVAFWPRSSAAEVFNGLLQAVPNRPGTSIFVESTANGMSGVFYDLWQGAIAGTNGFEAVFIPWFWQPEYREPVPEGFTQSPEELVLVEQYALDNEQLMFRRQRIGATSRDQFMQEYPCCPEEAFLTSGMPVFNLDRIRDQIETNAKDPAVRLSLEGDKWQQNPRGQLSVYEPRNRLDTYYIGADIAMGIKGRDYSVAAVLDGKKRLVAVWRGHIHPALFATVLARLGERYNWARIIPERNAHGILTCTMLAKDLAYPNVYLDESLGAITEDYRETIGFLTSTKTKPLIIDKLRASLIDGELTLFDRQTLFEMQRFVVTESGSMEADEGTDRDGEPFHDDCVMALALANHIHDGHFEPIPVTDDFYIEAI